ncbi:hypothetical protein [Paraburkholderia fungorum]|jgi:hypothetical protein|uniref:hypothetical protein n=1 Tax=Paraburkholderia fungorum TaxID=134537 RepID=UPI000D06DD23|nr:hypothetical protein [Paraburkholderia fungorum]PRZ45354.1 hypothetical protein BX589_13933 [Paraburkholderia fungorum]
MTNEQMEKRIEEVAELATEDFWARVASRFPEVKTGDFPPDAHLALKTATEQAIRVWLTFNHPEMQ